MPRLLRIILAAGLGLLAWFVVATVGDWLIRAALPGYAAAEPGLRFTLPMMIARLILGAVSSCAAGLVCAFAARALPVAAAVLAAVLLLLFLPVHYSLWSRFPFWYHATFLVSLVLLTLVGARAAQRFPAPRSPAT